MFNNKDYENHGCLAKPIMMHDDVGKFWLPDLRWQKATTHTTTTLGTGDSFKQNPYCGQETDIINIHCSLVTFLYIQPQPTPPSQFRYLKLGILVKRNIGTF